MVDPIALLRLPDPARARAYRESLGLRSHFAVDDLGDDVVAVAPAEGPGVAAEHFKLHRLCDAGTDLTAVTAWAPLRNHPPDRRSGFDAEAYREDMLRRGKEIVDRDPSPQANMAAFALAALAASECGDLVELLQLQLPPLFEKFPAGSLWLMSVEPVLLARLAFGRAQLALQLTPDMPLGPDMEQLSAFSGLMLTEGIDFGAPLALPLVVLSPAVLGFQIPCLPHSLVFCFGSDIDLRRPNPTSLASMYRPSVLNDAKGLDRAQLLQTTRVDDGPRLLIWWVERMNVLYSYATDPTRFTDTCGFHDAAAQTAWLVTLERLIADAISLLAEPQASDLHRVQMAFDLFDKAEGLLDYEKKKSGRGFVALLRRQRCLAGVRDSLSSLPSDLAKRLIDEVERLFDGLYAEVRENTASYRLTASGARVARGAPDQVQRLDDETLVATLLRAVRNSSHGLLHTLRESDDRYLLAANTGDVPAELAALAPLVALALLADPPALIDGAWRKRLAG